MNFEFNREHFVQIVGTAMGTALAPNFANVFMDRFKTRALAGAKLNPLVWKILIDDIFMIWTHDTQKLEEFIKYLNEIYPTSKKKIDFLDRSLIVREI